MADEDAVLGELPVAVGPAVAHPSEYGSRFLRDVAGGEGDPAHQPGGGISAPTNLLKRRRYGLVE